MYPHGFNNRGQTPPGFNNRGQAPPGFNTRGPPGFQDRTPTRASSFLSSQARLNRENSGQGDFFARAQTFGIRVSSPDDGQGVRETSVHDDPEKTPTQASVRPYQADKDKMPTQGSLFTLPQRTSGSGGVDYKQVQKEGEELMATNKSKNKEADHKALAQQFLHEFAAKNNIAAANKAALGGTEFALRNQTSSLGHDLASQGGNMYGREVGLGLSPNESALGGKNPVPGGSKDMLGGHPSLIGGYKLMTPFDYNKATQAATGASFLKPPHAGFPSYEAPASKIHAEPELRQAFKAASDRKKLPSDQQQVIPGLGMTTPGLGKAIPGLGKGISAYDKPSSAHEALGSAYDKPGSAYEKPGSAYERLGSVYNKPGSAYEKPGSAYEKPDFTYKKSTTAHDQSEETFDFDAHRKKLLEELTKKATENSKAVHEAGEAVFARSDDAFATRNASWARTSAATESGQIADEASKKAAACSAAGADHREAALFHRKAASEMRQLARRHRSAIGEHASAIAVHERTEAHLNELADLHENAFGMHTDLLTQKADVARTHEDVTHPDDALSHYHAAGDALTKARTSHDDSVQAIGARRSPFYGIIAPPGLPGDSQRRTTGQQGGSKPTDLSRVVVPEFLVDGPHGGTTTNAPTRRSQEQAFASRAQAHGIRIRSVDANEKDAQEKDAREKGPKKKAFKEKND